MTNLEFIIRITVAFTLGASLGFERQWRQRMAGLLTNTLVSVGACLFVMLSVLIGDETSPSRIASQVVSGIGFLAGGVILSEGLNVRGLNTAATLWCAAAIGSLTGSGFMSQAFLGAIAVLVAHLILPPLGEMINQQPLENTELYLCYQCKVICNSKHETQIRALLLQSLRENGTFKLRSMYREFLEDETKGKVKIEAEIVSKSNNDQLIEQVISRLSLEPKVISASWRLTEKEFV
ncbi:MgtC/SapB family protein [Cyanobacterium aponinum UTEX 3221]|uniref:MgtC/SapB family protein n=1 Tax=Cyanobacterium aponinum 0216 TaxID=2676140 RepID=A0A844GTQ0_9CHRO|nr:MgtC/SapB family protein [Cyanobacterium aponinum]MTF39877.1 MgtC/SapB family protein [Cyanobacterium aponinum 0216]PHV64366.1 hypothetical protein CSQ80_00665 [Cyanobacterium aponinum IPPAS B-1201]WRL40185.1 MgtC/SapB family protein [Cyanobacterium aponinum UTEX 3221]